MSVTDATGRLLFSLHFSAEIPSGPVTYLPQADTPRLDEQLSAKRLSAPVVEHRPISVARKAVRYGVTRNVQ